MKIIAIDDEFNSLALFLGEVLEESDVDCRFFACKEKEICDYCIQNDVDAAFLDILMPEISGIDLAKRLIVINPDRKSVV